jgi:hypothetical protein
MRNLMPLGYLGWGLALATLTMTSGAQPTSSANPGVTPNEYTLSSTTGVRVTYVSTSMTGQPVLTYQDARGSRTFRGAEIRTTSSGDIGTIVSVTTHMTIDTGNTTFSLLLPRVNLPKMTAAEPVTATGITTVHRFSVIATANMGQQDIMQPVELKGTARRIIF